MKKLASRLESLDSRIASHPLASSPTLAVQLGTLQAKRALAAAARAAKREARAAAGLVLGDELQQRQRVLRRLGYVDGEGLVTMKGRVAADLQVGWVVWGEGLGGGGCGVQGGGRGGVVSGERERYCMADEGLKAMILPLSSRPSSCFCVFFHSSSLSSSSLPPPLSPCPTKYWCSGAELVCIHWRFQQPYYPHPKKNDST